MQQVFERYDGNYHFCSAAFEVVMGSSTQQFVRTRGDANKLSSSQTAKQLEKPSTLRWICAISRRGVSGLALLV